MIYLRSHHRCMIHLHVPDLQQVKRDRCERGGREAEGDTERDNTSHGKREGDKEGECQEIEGQTEEGNGGGEEWYSLPFITLLTHSLSYTIC